MAQVLDAVEIVFDLILIVTHIEELRDQFPVHIEVRKTATGSTITVV